MLLDEGLGAVALYDGRQWQCSAPSDMAPSSKGLVDAVVYSTLPNMTTPHVKAMLGNLTVDKKLIAEDRS